MIINYSDQPVMTGKTSIFLAGPTPRDKNVPSWRPDAIKFLEDRHFKGVVYVPEYSTGEPMSDYIAQVEWERKALLNASVIVFWIPRKIPEMMALTTNVEFGYYLHTRKIIYGRPEDSEKNKYLDWLYEEDTKLKPFESLYETLNTALLAAKLIGPRNNPEFLPVSDRKIIVENNNTSAKSGLFARKTNTRRKP